MLRLRESISVNLALAVSFSLLMFAVENTFAAGGVRAEFNPVLPDDPRIQGVLDSVLQNRTAVQKEMMGMMMGQQTTTTAESVAAAVSAERVATMAAPEEAVSAVASERAAMMGARAGGAAVASPYADTPIILAASDMPSVSNTITSTRSSFFKVDLPLPIPAEDPRIKTILDSALQDEATIKDVMEATKNDIIARQAKAVPLRLEIGDAISRVVSDRVRKEVRDDTRRRQMPAMQDPASPDGIPIMIAPRFK